MHQAKYTLTQLVTYRKMYKCIVTLEDNTHAHTHLHESILMGFSCIFYYIKICLIQFNHKSRLFTITNTWLTETVMPSGRSKKHILHAANPHTLTDTIFFSFILLDTLEDNIHTHDMTKYGLREKRMNKDTLNRQAFPHFTHSGVKLSNSA